MFTHKHSWEVFIYKCSFLTKLHTEFMHPSLWCIWIIQAVLYGAFRLSSEEALTLTSVSYMKRLSGHGHLQHQYTSVFIYNALLSVRSFNTRQLITVTLDHRMDKLGRLASSQ